MASNKIKFEMVLKELAFKFEGDYEQGQKIQTGITKALGDIANLQSNAMGAKAPALIDIPASSAAPLRRKRKRKTQNGEIDGESSATENGAEPQKSERRSSSESPTLLIKTMRKTGFFETPKSAVDILNHLTTKGHTSFGHSDLTSPLANFCKQEILSRSKPEGSKTWQYSNGSKDE